MKVKLNISFYKYKDHKRQRYYVTTDKEICDEVQKVKMNYQKTVISESDQKTFKQVVNRLEFTRESGDRLGPLWSWMVVIPQRYFYIRFAKDSNDEYVKLPIQ